MLLSLLASISTIIGLLFINKINDNTIFKFIAFASGVMISLSLLELIPESYLKLNVYFNPFLSTLIILIIINIGLIISFTINNFLKTDDTIYRVGVMGMIAIILHNIPEGIITYIAGNLDLKLGFKMAISIALHNIPEGIVIAYPIYYSTKSYSRAFICTLISGMAEFIGSIIAFLFFKKIINEFFIAIMLSITSGIMIHISTYDIYVNKNRGSVGWLYILIGSIITFLSIYLI